MAYTGTSIVDYLNSIGQSSDYNTRASLAARMGISNYSGTASQNTQLLNMMRNATNTTPAVTTTSTPTQTSTQIQVPPNYLQQSTPQVSVNSQSILSPILSGQISPGNIDSYLREQVLNQFKTTYNANESNQYLNEFSTNGQREINKLKQQIEGQNIQFGGQSYTISNGQPVRTTTQSNQITVNTQGRYSSVENGAQYTVKSGDTLSAIASRNGITLQQLLQNNPQFQSNPNAIQPGQTVNISANAPTVEQYNNQYMVDNPQYGYNGTPNPTTVQEMANNQTNLSNQTGLNPTNLKATEGGYVDVISGQIYPAKQVIEQLATQAANATHASGYTVDPEMFKLTTFEDFMGEAKKFVDPYYTSQFDQVKNLVSTKLSQLGQDLGLKKDELQRTSEEQTRTGRETLAERGLTFSGQRKSFDTKSQEGLNRGLDLANTTAFRSGQDLLTQAEGQIGTANLQGINTSLGGRNLSFGNDVKGTLPYEQYGQTYNRALTLSGNENQRRQYAWNLQASSF